MSLGGFDVPVFLLLLISSGNQCNATLVCSVSVRGKDVVTEAMASVDWSGGRDSELCEDGNVNILGVQTSTHGDQSAVSAVLDVVCGDSDSRWTVLLRCRLAVSLRLFQEVL